jgi:two-component system, OmpR family, phosphate regulon sensor histidine kinase PhoR
MDEVEAVRQRLLNVVGHELRTPTTLLRGLADRLADADLEEIRSTLGPALQRNAARLERLVDDLLVAAGITSVLPVGDPRPVRLTGAVRRAWHAVGGDELEVTDEHAAAALVHPDVLDSILTHVLDNYRKYAAKPPQVRIALDGARVRVLIEAEGPRPHPEEIALALEAFYRGEHAVMTAPGLGLGLAVATRLAEHAAGDLAFEAPEAGGTRTVLTLPEASG